MNLGFYIIYYYSIEEQIIRKMLIYFFYKNFVFTFLQFIFGFYCNFTGQTIIDDWYITLFNFLFMSMPLGVRALLEHYIKPDCGEIVYLMLPFLYSENRENPIFGRIYKVQFPKFKFLN